MSWAKFAIEALQRGETVQIRPRGHSMRGKVNDGDLVTLEPCDPATLQPDDIVLVKVRGRDYLHLIKAVNGGDAKEKIQGPLTRNSVFQANKIIEGLGLTPDMERIIRQRVNSFNNADVKMPRFNAPTARASGQPIVVENHNTFMIDSDVLTRYVTRSQQKTQRRNPVQKRGPNRGI